MQKVNHEHIMTNNDIVQKLWNLCDVLRDDGISYSDYVTELVFLLFIKMAHENTAAGIIKEHPLPAGCRWEDIAGKSGIILLNDYKRILRCLSTGKNDDGELAHEDPLIEAIYSNAQTRLSEPKRLEQIIKTLNQIDWSSAQKDGLGALYEGLLEKNASETKSGAGQYFTPRALINCIVRCIKPQVGELIQDPAAGTGGFLVSAEQYMRCNTDNYQRLSSNALKFQRNIAFTGVELVPNTRRLALMNCLLHGMEGGNEGVVHLGNTLGEAGEALSPADVILANPPFGSSMREDISNSRIFKYSTTNKQLAFLQHIYSNLKPGGRAAVVLPDNVLFEGGVGTLVRRDLMNKCNLHTILRLPTGIFYAHGIKTNVLFFTKGSATDRYQEENCTQNVWIYDLRTNMPNFGKRTPFGDSTVGFAKKDFGKDPHLGAFEKVYGNNPNGISPRTEGDCNLDVRVNDNKNATKENQNSEKQLVHSYWRSFTREWIRDIKNDSLDINWVKENENIDVAIQPEPEELLSQAKVELNIALNELNILMAALEGAKI